MSEHDETKLAKRSRSHRINKWEDWAELCLQHDEDPHEIADLNFGIGGGDSISYEYIGEYPVREEK